MLIETVAAVAVGYVVSGHGPDAYAAAATPRGAEAAAVRYVGRPLSALPDCAEEDGSGPGRPVPCVWNRPDPSEAPGAEGTLIVLNNLLSAPGPVAGPRAAAEAARPAEVRPGPAVAAYPPGETLTVRSRAGWSAVLARLGVAPVPCGGSGPSGAALCVSEYRGQGGVWVKLRGLSSGALVELAAVRDSRELDAESPDSPGVAVG